MKVPKNQTIWIGNKEYKAGAELPADFKLPEKKKKQPEKQESKKIDA